MKRSIKGRLILILATIVFAVVCFLPNTPIYESMPQWWKDSMPDRGITLGLDLQGGLHLVYEVDVESVSAIWTDRYANYITSEARRKALAVGGAEIGAKVEGGEIVVSPIDAAVEKTILEDFDPLEKVSEGRFKVKDDYSRRYAKDAVDQALEKIRNRIDAYGVAEPTIVRQGETEIVVQLPGLKDPKDAIQYIGQTAQLMFKMVDRNSPLAAEFPQWIEDKDVDTFMASIANRVPAEDEVLFERYTDAASGKVLRRPYLVRKEAALTGDYLSEAGVRVDNRFNEPYVSIRFDGEGAKLFEQVTEENVGENMAIMLDGNIYSAPVIREKIAGGDAQISGSFTYEEAKRLSDVLEIGALPAPLKMLQNITVGPTLGRDSIEAGKMAGMAGGVLVIIFMIVYYRKAGLIADFALVLNILLLLGGMAALHATLTLPGIAGVILAIGMAVDSNVLMFERMREELRAGKTPRAAVDSGYDKAFWTIFDSHVTTLITAIVLFQFGTGPIKGFAVTLSMGVAINLFTALVGTKTMFDWMHQGKEVKELSI